MNSIRKRDYDADLERLKTFIDSYHNNDPETGKKGKILQKKGYFYMGSKMHFVSELQFYLKKKRFRSYDVLYDLYQVYALF